MAGACIENVGKMRHKLAMLADGSSPRALGVLVRMQDEVAEQVAKSKAQQLTALETSDREDEIGDWLEDHGIGGGWDYAPTFVEAGLDTDWLERVDASLCDADCSATLQSAIGWLKYTIDTELSVNRIAEASKRISALLAGTKQYSQMDRAPYQSADIHELLFSTLMMFGEKLGRTARFGSSRSWTSRCPNCMCYPGDLNPGVDEHHRERNQAMGGRGTLTLRTLRRASSSGWRSATTGGHCRTDHRPHLHRSSPQGVREGTDLRGSTWPGASSSRNTRATWWSLAR